MRSTFAPFRVRSYRFQWPADLLTSWALEMEFLILGWYVLVETGSVVLLTLFGALQHGGTLIAPILGVVSDRIGPRNLLTGMRLIYATIATTLMTLAFTGAINPVIVLVLVGFMGLVRPSDLGLRAALIADTMPHEQLTGAMGMSRITSDTARIAGALSGAGLFAWLGMGPAYVVIASFYALSALLTSQADSAHSKKATEPVTATVTGRVSAWSDLREGIIHIWNTPSLMAIIWLVLLFNFTAFPLTNALLPYVASDIYHADQAGLSYLIASISLGAMLGGVLMSRTGVSERLPRLMIAVGRRLACAAPGVRADANTDRRDRHAAGHRRVPKPHHGKPDGDPGARIRPTPPRPHHGRAHDGDLQPADRLADRRRLIKRVGFASTATLYAALGLACTIIIALRWREHMWPAVQPTPAE